MTDVRVDNVVPGALVSVFVNGVWRAAREATSTSVGVPAGQRRISETSRPDSVYAVQELCTSSVIGPDVSATMGKMTLSTDPDQVTVDSTQTVKMICQRRFPGQRAGLDQRPERRRDQPRLA